MLLGRGERRPIYTLRNGLGKQPRTLMRNEVELYGASTRTLAIDRHFLGIAAETPYVRLHPLQCLYLVEEACVEIPVRGVPQGGSSEEAK